MIPTGITCVINMAIYLEDEANLESHEYYYGEASLSHPEEWNNAHVARNLEMVHATINHPSIVIWSLGNEAGPGKNFTSAYEAIKKVDVSRPVQYERNNSIVDIGSNQYPSIDWVREAVKGKYRLKYPFHISEYAHSMGNASGNLIDYWEAIESTNFFMVVRFGIGSTNRCMRMTSRREIVMWRMEATSETGPTTEHL